MGGKRRENYDDWWRCEVRFDPVLDEAFGITHTKQQVRPQDYLHEILAPDLENIAKALNSRVRQAHVQLKNADRTIAVESIAGQRDLLLKPLPPSTTGSRQEALIENLAKRHPSIREILPPAESGFMQYRIIQDQVKDTSFFSFAVKEGLFVLVLNPEHPFYRKLYKPLIESESNESQALRTQIELLLLSAARAEAAVPREGQRESLFQFRKSWSDNLGTFLTK